MVADHQGGRDQSTVSRVRFPRDQQTPEALGSIQKADAEKWWPIIKAAGIKAE